MSHEILSFFEDYLGPGYLVWNTASYKVQCAGNQSRWIHYITAYQYWDTVQITVSLEFNHTHTGPWKAKILSYLHGNKVGVVDPRHVEEEAGVLFGPHVKLYNQPGTHELTSDISHKDRNTWWENYKKNQGTFTQDYYTVCTMRRHSGHSLWSCVCHYRSS